MEGLGLLVMEYPGILELALLRVSKCPDGRALDAKYCTLNGLGYPGPRNPAGSTTFCMVLVPETLMLGQLAS